MAINHDKLTQWGAILAKLDNSRPIKPGGRLVDGTRNALRAYAGAIGSQNTDALSDTDLIGVYLVGRKDPIAAERMLATVEARMGRAKAGFDPFAPDPMPLPVPGAGDPLPPLPAPSGSVDLDTVRVMIKTEVRTGVLAPLQSAMETLDTDLRARLGETETEVSRMVMALTANMESLALKACGEALKAMTPMRLEIERKDAPPLPLGLVHFKTPQIISMLATGVNVYLHGPAGSGKTTVGRKVAEAFGVKFYFAAKVESEYQLLGFTDAKGDAVRTQFREAYEHGGVFLFDEMDASSASAVVALNAALANGECPFPDGIVKRHAQFICLGAGNTKLSGASRQYAGRNQLDGSSVDRFAFVEFGYDDQLESALATNPAWCKYVQTVRGEVAKRGLAHLVTPRATYDGCKLLDAGLDWETVASACVYKGLDTDTRDQIERAVTVGA